jgi:hypothetical protein
MTSVALRAALRRSKPFFFVRGIRSWTMSDRAAWSQPLREDQRRSERGGRAKALQSPGSIAERAFAPRFPTARQLHMLTGAERMAGLNIGIGAEHNARARTFRSMLYSKYTRGEARWK